MAQGTEVSDVPLSLIFVAMAGLGRTPFRAGPLRSGRDDQAPPLNDGDSAATAASPAAIPQRHHSVEPNMGAHAVNAAGPDPLPEAPASDSTWTNIILYLMY